MTPTGIIEVLLDLPHLDVLVTEEARMALPRIKSLDQPAISNKVIGGDLLIQIGDLVLEMRSYFLHCLHLFTI